MSRTVYECRHGFTREQCLAPCCEFAFENAAAFSLTIREIVDRAGSEKQPHRRETKTRAVLALSMKLPLTENINLRDRDVWQQARNDAVCDGLARETARRYLLEVWALIY